MLDDCTSLAASTDEILWSDDDTIVADMENIWHEDLAAIRRLLDSEGGGGGTCCPSCEMPFDKGKKRRLIDTCGHERCYTCMFTNEACPLCNANTGDQLDGLLPNKQIPKDLAAIRRLLDSEGGGGGTCCPSCEMPFDKGKKRRLIDTCGHERCYTCMFTNEACPLCNANTGDQLDGLLPNKQIPKAPSPVPMGRAGLRGSEITLYGESGCPVTSTRPKVKTNGHFTSFMQSRQDLSTSGTEWPSPTRLPKARPSGSRSSTTTPQSTLTPNSADAMSQSCPTPTPPQNRRRFFLSPRALRSPFAQRATSRQQRAHEQAMSASATEVLSKPFGSPPATMSTSACSDGGRGWPSVVLGKIRSLWSATGSSTGAGLNQLADDEGGGVKPPSTATRKSSQNDLYMRLGLLLGDGARRRAGRNAGRTTGESCSSLASCDTTAMMSTNTSPVSTLTGSSEDPHRNNPSSESVGSLMSMSMSGQSNCSSSPVSRRHSVTTTQAGQVEDLGMFRNRRTQVRRSARTGTVKGPVDPKIRFAQYRSPQLTLKPLFFEVPLQEPDPLFVGRQWLVREIEDILETTSSGVLLSGNPGTGKTALVLQLVEYSCFGRRKESQDNCSSPEPVIQHQIGVASERLKQLASDVVAYHFCQADNNTTCLVPDFVHSLAAQLCQAPQLIAYRNQLLEEPHLQGVVSLKECIADPDLAFNRGILEPLVGLRRLGKIENRNCIIIVDALCEAEYHRPDNGDTIASFLAKHTSAFPSWLKVISTVRTQLLEIVKQVPYTRISLDKPSDSHKDLLDYISFRVNNSPSIQSNVTIASGKPEGNSQYRFAQHLVSLSQGSFLFAKLTLDLLERGHLVAKSSGYKVLPVSLAQIFLLHFNLRFPTIRSFEKVCHILSVCLSALYPLTLLEIYYSVNSLLVDQFLPWEEFLQRFKLLSGFLVKRLDNTYMFFHPSFREWLIRRDENESTKFVCDLRAGHAAIAFRLSRVQAPLDADKTLELGHHILKAHVYRNVQGVSSRDLQANWVASSSFCTSSALCSLRNVYSPNVKVSRLLLLAGASPDHTTEFLGDAPVLCMFAHEGVVPMVSLLLEFGADVELTNSQGSTSLSLASSKGHCDVVRQLIAAGASPGHTDTSGRCALVHAARSGRLNVVGYLLACDWVTGNYASEKDDEVTLVEAAQQALVASAAQEHTEVVEYLLDMAEVNADSPDTLTGETALTVAAANGCVGVVSALIGRGADASVPNRRDLPPLLVAAREGHWAVAERLLQARAPLEQCDSAGRTALSLAASEGHVGIIELLLDRGATLDRQDRDGLTALCWACVRGRVQAAQCLLDRGANIAHTDKTGRTPLDLAAFQGGATLVQLLLDRGALIEHVDINGMRPLDRAIGCRNIQVVQCFLRKGAKLGPATWAMAAGKPDIMLILLNKLLEDGNVLYRKSRLKEAAHRYQYALKKFPTEEIAGSEHAANFYQLRINFLLNQSRCKRKMNESEEAIELADQVLVLRPDSYEAYYARAKARADAGMYDGALSDVREALRFTPASHAHGPEVRRVLGHLRDEITARMSSRAGVSAHRRELAASVDTLNEH